MDRRWSAFQFSLDPDTSQTSHINAREQANSSERQRQASHLHCGDLNDGDTTRRQRRSVRGPVQAETVGISSWQVRMCTKGARWFVGNARKTLVRYDSHSTGLGVPTTVTSSYRLCVTGASMLGSAVILGQTETLRKLALSPLGVFFNNTNDSSSDAPPPSPLRQLQ